MKQPKGHGALLAMKAAFSFWNERIAPVFDVARQILLVEVESGRIVRETEEKIPADNPGEKAGKLAGLGVNVLVCGAVSRFMHEFITAYGIKVIPFISGDLREVMGAWEGNKLEESTYAMPGCCTRARGIPGCGDGSRQCRLYICPSCGHRRRFGKGIQDSAAVCPRCGSIMTNERR